MEIEQFAKIYLNFKDPIALEVYQGYLIAGKTDKQPRCFWINKQNIEGLAEVAKIVTIDSAFHGILSLIPGGSFAYRLIKDQIGYPPRCNIIFEPRFYEITYTLITLDKKGQKKGIINGLVQGIDNVTRFALKTGIKVQDKVRELIIPTKSKEKKIETKTDSSENEIFGFTYLRFEDISSIVRNRIIKDRLDKTNSRTSKLAKTAIAEMVPSVAASFKTIANEEAIEFLKKMQELKFKVVFTELSSK